MVLSRSELEESALSCLERGGIRGIVPPGRPLLSTLHQQRAERITLDVTQHDANVFILVDWECFEPSLPDATTAMIMVSITSHGGARRSRHDGSSPRFRTARVPWTTSYPDYTKDVKIKQCDVIFIKQCDVVFIRRHGSDRESCNAASDPMLTRHCSFDHKTARIHRTATVW